MFNYIITIHNKEYMLREVLQHVLMCCRGDSHVYAVLDGCTDNSETVVDTLVGEYGKVPLIKVHTPDVHELRAINAGLKAARQDGEGYNIILQDDVMLADLEIEEKVKHLYAWAGDDLGFISFRLGLNFKKNWGRSDEPFPFKDKVENAYGHGLPDAQVLLPGQFAYRAIPIKSPICIPSWLIREIGLPDERLAPWDDAGYAARSLKAGYKNGVFALRFYSKLEWGTTRQSSNKQNQHTQGKNMPLIRELYRDCWDMRSFYDIDDRIYDIPGMTSEAEKKQALEYHKKVVTKLKKYRTREKLRLRNVHRLCVRLIRKLISWLFSGRGS